MGLKGEAGQILQLTDKNKSTAETNSSIHFKEGEKKKSFKEDLLFFPPISQISGSALNYFSKE